MTITVSSDSASFRLVGISVLSVLAAGLAACGEAPSPPPVPTQEGPRPQPKPAPGSALAPAPDRTLSRKDLLEAAAQAASAYAAGSVIPAKDRLVGRPFAVRIAFGCQGPLTAGNEEPGIGHWSWSADRKTIRLSMTPADWRGSALLAQADAGETWEAVEGFWMPRPWLSADGCPGVKTDPPGSPTQAASQTLGLAAVFDAGGSRVGRRAGRAYQYTIRPKDDVPLAEPAAGYRLLLKGRAAEFPGGAAIACHAPGPDDRPVCIVAARLDKVTMESADGATLAEWRTE